MSEAPKCTKEDVEKLVVSWTYTVLPDGRTTICQGTLQNGFTVMGKSACVSKDNFDEKLGQEYAYEDLINQVWPLAGLLLAERLYQEKKSKGDTWVDRLYLEWKQCYDRLQKLMDTVSSPPSNILEADLKLLNEQMNLMVDLEAVLRIRLDRARQG